MAESAFVPSFHDVVTLHAAIDGDLVLLKAMAAGEVNLHEAKDEKGQGVLLLAAVNGHLEVCRFLVDELGLDVNCMSAGVAPVHVAAGHGHKSVLRYLLDRGGDPWMLDSEGTSLLHFAVMGGDCQVVRLVLSKGIDVDPPDYVGLGTPLLVAAFNARVEDAAMVEERIADAMSQGKEAFAKGEYTTAIYFYCLAMEKDSSDATLFANRSLCWLRLRDGDEALSDARRCVLMRPHWSKAWDRMGAALSFLKDYKAAVVAFEQALKLDPVSDEIKKALREAFAGIEGTAASMDQGHP